MLLKMQKKMQKKCTLSLDTYHFKGISDNFVKCHEHIVTRFNKKCDFYCLD
jgi:hypothetical protein